MDTALNEDKETISRELKELEEINPAEYESISAAWKDVQNYATSLHPLPSDINTARTQLLSSITMAQLSVGNLQTLFTQLSQKAKGIVQRVVSWFMNNVVSVIATISSLNVQSWGFSVQGGFPLGVNLSLNVTFS